MTDYRPFIDPLCNLATVAGEKIMTFYNSGEHNAELKDDNSPVTDADLAAHRCIVEALAQLTPEIPIVSEENKTHPDVAAHPYFWLVDPLDGTKSFIKRSGEFTVNIALIEGDKPVLGVIYVPCQKVLYYGTAGQGAYKQSGMDMPVKITVRTPPEEGVTAVVSLSHMSPETGAFLETVTVADTISASSSLKFCLVAEGRADVYPRFGRTMEWDTAAGQAIAEAAGGRVETTDGKPFTYRKEADFANPGFIVWGG